ncbi:hypothetical protein BC835DRAFT_1309654 [Cytidiella melzeri]|nr:hypothetical protein BC835DRAFT_1309654 [Cytidiella melzeri]
MRNMVDTLKGLPHLRSVELLQVQLDGSLSAGDYEEPFGKRKLDTFAYRGRYSPDKDGTVAFLEIISLFSEIGRLELRDSFHKWPELDALSDAAANSIVNLKVGELVVDTVESAMHPPYLPLILTRDLNVLSHLTCLTFVIEDPVPDLMQSFSKLLCTAGATLGELYLNLSVAIENQVYSDHALQATTAVSALRSGLDACVVLHGFRLTLVLYNEQLYDEDQHFEYVNTQVLAWSLAVDIIGLVPIEQLRHLSFCFWSYNHHKSKETDVSALPWFKLRNVCRRFNDLRSLKVLVSKDVDALSRHDKVEKKIGVECVRHELREFSDVLQRGESCGFRACEQDSCRWSRESRNATNSYS